MKNNVRDYIRTDIGEIRKVVRVTEDLYVLDKDIVFAHKDKIKKSSPNIIDLIEIGDYVNGIKIETKYYSNVNQEWIVAEDCGDDYYDCKFTNENIKTVVTKEQMKQMEYKINE